MVRIATDDILSVGDVRSEKRALDLTQEKFAPRINVGRTGGMEGFTEPPNLSDLSCVGALPLRCNPGSK